MSIIKKFIQLSIIFYIISGCNKETSTLKALNFNITSLKVPIRINKIKKLFGKPFQGHGPYVWLPKYKDNKIEFWFFYEKLSEKEIEQNPNPQIVFIIEAGEKKENEPETQSVLWPNHLTHKTFKDIYQLFYKER